MIKFIKSVKSAYAKCGKKSATYEIYEGVDCNEPYSTTAPFYLAYPDRTAPKRPCQTLEEAERLISQWEEAYRTGRAQR